MGLAAITIWVWSVTMTPNDESDTHPTAAAKRTPKRTKEQMAEENESLFRQIVDLRAAGVQRRSRFDYTFTTDGICARLLMRPREISTSGGNNAWRGIWSIDQLHLTRIECLT